MKTFLASLATLGALAATSAQATPVRLDGAETNLQQIVDDLAVDGSSSVDVVNDQYALDQGWEINSVFWPSGDIVLELAGYAGQNSFGLYDIYDPNNRVQLFGGSAGAGTTAVFNIDAGGHVYRNYSNTGSTFASNVFGFYLETPDGLWFSQSDLNTDAADHLVAYQGQGEWVNTPFGPRNWTSQTFLLAWEDLTSSAWDQDYNDFVLFVSGVRGVNVPEPATLGLFGLGLMGAGFLRRRRAGA